MLLIGSKALKQHCPDFRNGPDSDFMAYENEVIDFANSLGVCKIIKTNYNHVKFTKGNDIYEFELIQPNTSSEIIVKNHANSNKSVADLDTLLLLKMSHRYKKNSVHFLKTMRDIQYLRKAGAKIADNKLLKMRERETYNYNHPNLNQNKASFFTDTIPYQYDHDSIHRTVAIADKPAYLSYLKDDAEVACDKSKWDRLPERIKLNGVTEECYVLALERSIIPFKTDPYKAFLKSLEGVCTRITSGWFREYAWENYDNVIANYDPSFVHKFHNALNNKQILPFRGNYGN